MGVPVGASLPPTRLVEFIHDGISYPVPYNYDLDNEANSFVNPLTGHKMARGVIDWFFCKGEVYTDGYTVTKPIHFPFTSGELMAASISIYSCDSSIAPRDAAAPDAQNVSTVFFDFSQLHFPSLGPKMVGGQVHYDLQVIVRFRFDGCNERGVFEVTAQGRSLSTLELDLN
ncbi:uncharacterized protein LDX57_004249 [Aspergillus melleus]|uniref:uncharacterized protein n=1 Tax=Aspergillus melleus TaxID=138277 RepID=UPI001E8D6718|nr:uncharacterized protein LDX57_004249 [Aspergillus melleus]KAH8426514.1 hypothetical protein LDX57_004249 [Aspergillus melleus]